MRREVRIRFVIAAMLVAASILPNLGFQVNTFGFSWNFYRVVIVISMVLILILSRGSFSIANRKSFLSWMAFFLFWIAYGVALLVISKYAERSRGMQEMFAIACGLLVFFGFSGLSLSTREREWLLRILFFLLAGLILLGFYEILTANHLSTSMFKDPNNKTLYRVDPHTAAGIMYNINDFSALLTILCPVVIGRFRIHLRRGFVDPGWLLVLGVFAINRINDANICSIGLMLGIFLYFTFSVVRDRRSLGRVLLAVVLVLAALIAVYLLLGKSTGGLLARWEQQVSENDVDKGSMHARFLIYKDALDVSWESGLMGLGPGGFPEYFTRNPSTSGFINPHSMLMELISEYGLPVFALFMALLVVLFRRMYRLFRRGPTEEIRNHGLMGVLFIVVYLVASFAPSSFLLNSYPWAIFALLCLIWEQEKDSLPKEEEVWVSDMQMGLTKGEETV